VYGGERTISPLVSQIREFVAQTKGPLFSYEIVLVCDHSPDDSWDVIRDLAINYKEVRGILLRMNAGQHNALMAGFEYAKGEVIVTMDDDLQHSPNDIGFLLDGIYSGRDVVYASFAKRKHSLWKVAGSYFNNVVASFLIKKPRDLYLSPFRALTVKIKNELLMYRGPYVYIDGLILTLTRNIGSIEVAHYKRTDGQGNYGLKKSLSLWLRMATNFSIFPLRLTSIIGITISFIGFIFAILLIIQKLTINLMPIGWSSLIVTILIMGGIQLLAIGMVGEYLGRVYLTLNSHHQYVIEDQVGCEPIRSCSLD
jgi:undecaprenyl-phosphate 4-deoxy-4-formamido-L-arabinose transferase